MQERIGISSIAIYMGYHYTGFMPIADFYKRYREANL